MEFKVLNNQALREICSLLWKLSGPDSFLEIERIGNGYVIHNSIYGWKEFCGNKEELSKKMQQAIEELP